MHTELSLKNLGCCGKSRSYPVGTEAKGGDAWSGGISARAAEAQETDSETVIVCLEELADRGVWAETRYLMNARAPYTQYH